MEDEVSLLRSETSNGGIVKDESIFSHFLREEWLMILQSENIKILLAAIRTTKQESDEDFNNLLLNWLKENVKETYESHTVFALFGILCLKLFLQANWTGPMVKPEDLDDFGKLLESKELNTKCLQLLESDGEEAYQLMMYPVLLFLAKSILITCRTTIHMFTTLPIWSVKCMATHCAVLAEIRDSHFRRFQSIVESVDNNNNAFMNLPSEVLAEFYLDCSHLYLKFYDYKNAEECCNKVKNLLKIDISLTAALGKRTKFQVKDLPQMMLGVKVDPERKTVRTVGQSTQDLPTDIILDDDTLLPHIKFINADNVKNVQLTAIDQAFALTCCMYLEKTRPRDKLSHEEITPFLDVVLQTPQSWAVQHRSLYMRCLTEVSNSRKAERALNQLESLTTSIEKPTPKACDRQFYLHSVNMEPTWLCQRTQAQLLYVIGLVDSALDIFLRWRLWDDVISSYQRLGKHGKAEAIIRQQLEIKETPTLWCLLGDVTAKKEHYEKAWLLSNSRSARAQRSLGLYHLRQNEFEQAIPYFQKSLELNCLQPDIAFSLGCCGMSTQKLDIATKALQQSCQLEPSNPQAWSNLGSCFIRLNKLDQAYKALQEGTRLSYDNWKIWENYLLVCADMGAFEDTIYALHRLVDIGRKDLDTEVLYILVESVLHDVEDFKGVPCGRLKPKLLKLFGHITSQITDVPNVWEEYAKLCLSSAEPTDKEKSLQFLYKAHRCYTQHTDWEKSEKNLPAVKRVTDKMLEVTKDVCSLESYKARAISLYSTTKMALSNLVLRLKKAYTSDLNKILPSVQPLITEFEEEIRILQHSIDGV